MTGPASSRTCQVSFLVPHPSRTAVLVDSGARARLPTVVLADPEPSTSAIVDSADMLDSAATVVLRQVITSSEAEPDEISLLVECDAYAATPSSGWTWLDLDAQAIARLEPEACRPAVVSWLHERADGWSRLRPEWSRPGWFAEASAWMVAQLAAAGRPALAAPQQHQLWGISTVLRAPTAEGAVFFKCPCHLFAHEATVTRALAELMPGVTSEVIAVDEARGWLLMSDLGAPELGEQDEVLWSHGLVAQANIQQAMLSRPGELDRLRLPVRSLPGLAALVDEIGADAALRDRMPAGLHERWLAAAPALIESCLRLNAIGPGPTLVHGDLHPWNVVYGDGTPRIFDWSDAATSHPFVDLATYVFRTSDLSVRRRLVDAHVGAWSTYGSDDSLHEAATLALVVGALYQVQTYRALLPTLMRNGADDGLADGDLDWINRTVTRLEQGLESPK